MSTVVPFKEARAIVEEHASTLRATEPEPCELLDCRGRVLAEDIVCDRDLPPFPRSTRDGFAVRSSDLEKLPARLVVAGEIRAGADPAALGRNLDSGEAMEIMTGAPAPSGADAVVMIEYTRRDGEFVEVQRGVARGENIVPTGSEAKSGERVLGRGERMDAARIAVAASVGATRFAVHRRPRVLILSTGDEIVDVAAAPGPAQIRNSNSYSLAAQVEACGGIPAILPIAPDELDPLRKLVATGLAADLLLLAGGVSAGKYDLVEQVLAGFDAEFFFTGALIQPGKPIVFGRARRVPGTHPTYFAGLPGNPISTMVCFELFARPLLAALSGATAEPLRYLQSRLAAEIKIKPGLTRFLPGLLSGALDATEVRLAPWHGSGDVVGTARANCWIVIPPDRERIEAGEFVPVIERR